MPSLFSELNRRNVFRVAVAYAVAAWLVLQIADLLLDNIEAPPWVIQSLFVVVGVGFVFALIFSWVYELTPQGLVRESEVAAGHSITAHTAKKLNYVTIALLLLAVGYLLLDRFVLESPVQTATPADSENLSQEPPAATVRPNSIAILPFSDLSENGDQAYFSDGIAEELLNLLAHVDGLEVASRTSSFAFKGQNRAIPDIAAELKVANILEGSVRKAGNRVRITAQLIDTRDDRHLWSDTFDRELVDIFAIQDEIATAIVNALKNQLGVRAAPDSIVVKAATGNLDAYELYLKGRNLFIARQNLDQAIELFQRAIELDPNYARAWEGLAAAQRVANDWILDDGIDHEPLAVEAARRALDLDPELSMPYAVLAGYGMNRSPDTGIDDLGEAEQLLDLALLKDSNNTSAWLWRGILFNVLGYFERGMADLDECLRRDPAYLNCAQHRAASLLYLGDADAALAAFTPTLFEDFHSMDEAFVPVLVERGDPLAAVLMATAKLGVPNAPVGEWIRALQYPDQDHSAGLARFDAWGAEAGHDYLQDVPSILLAFGAYERAVKSPMLRFVLWGNEAKAFRKTKFFKKYMRVSGVEDYWRKHGFPPMCRDLGGQNFACD